MEEKLREYAKLLIELGVNVQPGQTLVIASPVDCAHFARLCAAEAYAAGCREVVMNWRDDQLERLRLSKPLLALTKYMAELVDEDGYLRFSLPWSFTVSYGISMAEDRSKQINVRRMRYPYSFTQTMNFSGYLRIAEGWNISFTSGYDFNYHELSMTTASVSRDLHCFEMSCSVVLRPYSSFNFTFRARANELADALKWDKRSSYSSNIEWY